MNINWDQDPYKKMLDDANSAVKQLMDQLRGTQKLVSAITVDLTGNRLPMGVPDNKINFIENTIPDRSDKQFVEIYLEFYLTDTGVTTSGRLQTLALNLVPALAQAEDFYIFQISEKPHFHRDQVPAHVSISNWRLEDGHRDYGLLFEANPKDRSDCDWSKVSTPIHVPLEDDGTRWGVKTADAVFRGITKLITKKGKGNQGFALFLPTDAWADAMLPVFDDRTTASLFSTTGEMGVDMEVLPCASLPKDEGLLVNLVGDPVQIFYGQQPQIEVEAFDKGRHKFRIVERVQYVVSDPRALLLLKFEQPTEHHSKATQSKAAQSKAGQSKAESIEQPKT